jgi:hypothetical protein
VKILERNMRIGNRTFAVLMCAMRLSTDVAAGQENISSLAPLICIQQADHLRDAANGEMGRMAA